MISSPPPAGMKAGFAGEERAASPTPIRAKEGQPWQPAVYVDRSLLPAYDDANNRLLDCFKEAG